AGQVGSAGQSDPARLNTVARESAARANVARAGEGTEDAAAWSAHTHHAPASVGSRCVECHMSDVNWRLFTRRRDHTFQPPVPEMTGRYGVPNACTTCHEDKPPEWAASVMDRWYGNGERRRAAVATGDVMYRARAGDRAGLAADRTHGALIRASAAEFAGQLITKQATAERAELAEKKNQQDTSASSASSVVSFVNALIGAAADPEPMVRVAAVRALAAIDDPRALAVLAAHLTDDSRLVRVSAAEGLLNRGIAALDGSRGPALARAQDEWAESLRTFNDLAAEHTTLGWLEASRGRTDEARQALRTAIDLDPRDARPHVYLGVIAARAGDYDEALKRWKIAKTLAPA